MRKTYKDALKALRKKQKNEREVLEKEYKVIGCLPIEPKYIFITQEDAYSALAGVYATLQNEATFTNVRNAADIEWAITGDLYEMDRSANRIELHSLRFPASNTILRDIYQNSYYQNQYFLLCF